VVRRPSRVGEWRRSAPLSLRVEGGEVERLGPHLVVRALSRSVGSDRLDVVRAEDGERLCVRLATPEAVGSEARVDALERRLDALARVRHPCWARLAEVGRAAVPGGVPRPFLASVRPRGRPGDARRRDGLDPIEALGRLARVAGVLEHLSALGLGHGALDGSCVFVDEAGAVELCDPAFDVDDRTVGDPAACPPEGGLAPAGDVFALAVLALRWLSEGLPAAERPSRFASIAARLPALPDLRALPDGRRLEALLTAAVVAAPEIRPTMRVLGEGLRRSAREAERGRRAGGPGGSTPPPPLL
jgi:hypothetical protein